MFLPKHRILFPLCLFLLIIVGCGTSRKATQAKSELPFNTTSFLNEEGTKKKGKKKGDGSLRKQLTPTELQLFNAYFHEAIICLENNEIDAHRVLLERALEIDSTAPEALCHLARVQYIYSQRHDSLLRQEALRNLERAVRYAPTDLDILEDYALMLGEEGHVEKAQKCYEYMASLNPTKTVLLHLAKTYSEQQRYTDALSIYDYLERQGGSNKEIERGKLTTYAESKDSVRLFTYLDSLITERPNVYQYQLLKGQLYDGYYNRPDSAIAIYKNVLKQSPNNATTQSQLLDFYAARNDYENFFHYFKLIVANKHIEENYRAQTLRSFISHCIHEQEGYLPKIRAFLDSLSHPENSTGEILEIHTALLSHMKASPDSLLSVIDCTLHFQPENTFIRIEGVRHCFVNEWHDELIRLSDEGQYYDPQEIRFYYFSTIFKLRMGKEDEALQTLERGERYFMESPDDTLAAELFALMGDMYYERDDLEHSFAAYDSALVCIPDQVTVLNNYAYYLSLNGRDLTKAMSMAHRACELAPNEPTYLDTYAWVLYQMGQYTQARIYIDQVLAAIKEGEESHTYYQHAGDIYWKLGDRKSARKFWKRAEELQKANAHNE